MTAFLDSLSAAAALAGEHAEDVDAHSRFPKEALDALREARALSALVDGVPFDAVARACELLARRCSATAMVFAMHQIQVAVLVQHRDAWPWVETYLADLSREQRLISSVTSEIGTGGDMGRSVAAVEPGWTFTKQAPTVSYGEYADDYLTTLRRTPDSEPSDQVTVLSLGSQTTATKVSNWDTLGMRGTCSPGFTISATVAPEQVLPIPFGQIMNETLVPVSHLLWAHVWMGIAGEAFERARRCTRKSGATGGTAKTQRLSELHGDLVATRAQVAEALARWQRESSEPDRPALQTMSAVLRHNVLKTSVSQAAARICMGAMEVCGIAGYRNDSPYSIGRLLRDSLSAPLMIANERLHEHNAALLMVVKET